MMQILDRALMYMFQAAPMPWDDAVSWEDGLRSLRYLQRFLLRSWRSFREGNSIEDQLVLQWLIFSPPILHDVIVWTGARQGQGRMVRWNFDDGMGVWNKFYEGDSDNASFV